MTRALRIFALAVPIFMIHSSASSQDQTSSRPAHVRSGFNFTLSVPLDRAAPLFGPEGERCWAGEHWNPEFLYPQPGQDVEGAVFTVAHGTRKSIWVNTVFDLSAGRMQYVNFIPDVLVSTIDVHLVALNEKTTRIEVMYARTALSAAANDDVHAQARSARMSGAHWQEAIQRCLEKQTRPNLREEQ